MITDIKTLMRIINKKTLESTRVPLMMNIMNIILTLESTQAMTLTMPMLTKEVLKIFMRITPITIPIKKQIKYFYILVHAVPLITQNPNKKLQS